MPTIVRTASTSLGDLQADFLRIPTALHTRERRQGIGDVLLHSESQTRLRSACGAVLRRWSTRTDLRGDVMQEATCHLLSRWTNAPIRYVDRGADQFGGWLWGMWYSACRTAWRNTRPLWMRHTTLCSDEILGQVPVPESRPAADEVRELFTETGDERMQSILRDWWAGLTVRESAERQRISKSEIGRLRGRLVEKLRRTTPTEAASHITRNWEVPSGGEPARRTMTGSW